MRHRHKGRKLNRTSSHRAALLKNLAKAVIEHEKINTTLCKAKELRRVVERLITIAKKDTVANRRLAFKVVADKSLVGKLFTEIGPHYLQRPGGYLRVLKSGFRHGDNAPMAYVELVDRASID